jgi:hypothetical protein
MMVPLLHVFILMKTVDMINNDMYNSPHRQRIKEINMTTIYTPEQYFYNIAEAHLNLESPLTGKVKMELSACGQCNDELFVGDQLVAKGYRAHKLYDASPVSIRVQ